MTFGFPTRSRCGPRPDQASKSGKRRPGLERRASVGKYEGWARETGFGKVLEKGVGYMFAGTHDLKSDVLQW